MNEGLRWEVVVRGAPVARCVSEDIAREIARRWTSVAAAATVTLCADLETEYKRLATLYRESEAALANISAAVDRAGFDGDEEARRACALAYPILHAVCEAMRPEGEQTEDALDAHAQSRTLPAMEAPFTFEQVEIACGACGGQPSSSSAVKVGSVDTDELRDAYDLREIYGADSDSRVIALCDEVDRLRATIEVAKRTSGAK